MSSTFCRFRVFCTGNDIKGDIGEITVLLFHLCPVFQFHDPDIHRQRLGLQCIGPVFADSLTLPVLLQPFMPFVTEEIYLTIPHRKESINLETWPKPIENLPVSDLESMERVLSAIQKIREVKNVNDIKPGTVIHVMLRDLSGSIIPADPKLAAIIAKMAKAEWKDDLSGDLAVETIRLGSLNIPSNELADPAEEIKKLNAEKERLEKEIARSNGILSNPGFLNKAPAAKVELEKKKLEEYQQQYQTVLNRLNALA